MELKEGWLKDHVNDCSAEVATWNPDMRGYPDTAIKDDSLLMGIEKLRRRLMELETEAGRRGLKEAL